MDLCPREEWPFLNGFSVIFGPVFDVFFHDHFCRNLFPYDGLNSGY